jgi:hypothetical protein
MRIVNRDRFNRRVLAPLATVCLVLGINIAVFKNITFNGHPVSLLVAIALWGIGVLALVSIEESQ